MDYKTNHLRKIFLRQIIFTTNIFQDQSLRKAPPPDRPYGTLTYLTLTKGQAPGPSLLFIIGYEKLFFYYLM